MNTRYVGIGNNEDEKVSTGKMVRLEIVATIPILVMTDSVVSSATIRKQDYAPPELVDIKNALIDTVYKDEHGVERFIFITATTKAITGRSLRLYYDRAEKDIIIVPDLETLGINANYGKGVYDIPGVLRLGGSGSNSEASLNNTINNSDRVEITPTKENIASSTHTIVGKGIVRSNAVKMIINRNFLDEKFEAMSNDTQIGELLSLGKIRDLLDGGVELPVYRTFQANHSEYSTLYLGEVDTEEDNLYISLDL